METLSSSSLKVFLYRPVPSSSKEFVLYLLCQNEIRIREKNRSSSNI
jgi:hypothetical protein